MGTPETDITSYSLDQGLTHSPFEEPLYLELPGPPKLRLDLLEPAAGISSSEPNGHSPQWSDENVPLRTAISERNRFVYSNASGTVVAGTLEGLVDRLVHNFSG
jgi:hypothetical protein